MALYKRVLLKLSGEALAGEQKFGIVPEAIQPICREVKKLHSTGVQIAIVIGGGNIFRGIKSSEQGMDRVTADYMGMLGTVINSLAIQDTLEKMGIPARLMSSIPIVELSEPFIRRKAMRYLEKNQIVIFAGGTGNPFFSTDTAASLRAAQINADAIFKGTKVDGVYDSDPVTNPSAKKFDVISFNEVINRGLMVMDTTAIAMCKDNGIPITVFNLAKEDALLRIANGESEGTIVKEDDNG
ncbi:UMP kinase [Candidatus Latescibacterota bacterium]